MSSDVPHWLLSVDDDEFVSVSRTISNEFLDPMTRLADWIVNQSKSTPTPIFRFRYRCVGTNNLTKTSQPGELDIERYTKAGKAWHTKHGKSIFYLNHPNMTIRAWARHDQPGEPFGEVTNKRKGGPLFMHGYDPEVSYTEGGFVYHFSRSRDQLNHRATRWPGKSKNPDEKELRCNQDEVEDLKGWGGRVRQIILQHIPEWGIKKVHY